MQRARRPALPGAASTAGRRVEQRRNSAATHAYPNDYEGLSHIPKLRTWQPTTVLRRWVLCKSRHPRCGFGLGLGIGVG